VKSEAAQQTANSQHMSLLEGEFNVTLLMLLEMKKNFW